MSVQEDEPPGGHALEAVVVAQVGEKRSRPGSCCGSGEVDLDRNRSAERVAHRRAAGDLRVESLKLVLGGVRRDVDLDPNRFVAGVLALQPEERVQVEVSFKRDRMSSISIPAIEAFAAHPTARQLPSAARSCSTGLAATSGLSAIFAANPPQPPRFTSFRNVVVLICPTRAR